MTDEGRIVVTGASGFVGAALVRALREAGMAVVPVARRPVPGGVLVGDYAQTPPEEVLVHLAEDNDRASAETRGEAHMRESSRVMRALLAKGYRKVLYASSSALYGDRLATPRRPDEPVLAEDAYARAKHANERMVLESGRGIVVRLANVYGPGMSGSSVMSAILRQIRARNDAPLYLWDDAPVRDFLWIGDAAAGLTAIARSVSFEEAGRAIYNVGSGTGCSVGALARLALLIAGQASRKIVATKPSGRESTLVLDITKTTTDFSWRPLVDIKQGLAALIHSLSNGT